MPDWLAGRLAREEPAGPDAQPPPPDNPGRRVRRLPVHRPPAPALPHLPDAQHDELLRYIYFLFYYYTSTTGFLILANSS